MAKYKVIGVTYDYKVITIEVDDYSDAVNAYYDMLARPVESAHIAEKGDYGYDNPDIYADDMPDMPYDTEGDNNNG